jgi:hypothetical protein
MAELLDSRSRGNGIKAVGFNDYRESISSYFFLAFLISAHEGMT